MRMEKHGRGVEQARRMLDTFASLGVNAFDLTGTDVDGQKRGFQPAVDLAALRRGMAQLLEAAIQQQHNLIVRPKHADAAGLIQLDDVSGEMVEQLRSAALLILATSVGNYQVWVAAPECTPDFARRLRQGSGADRGASGATRLAGSLNFKRKYAPHFPQVEILQATLQHTVTAAALEALGVVAAPKAKPATCPGRVSLSTRAKRWPSYERCLQLAPPARHSDRPDVSRADFTFCLLAIDWGWSLEETCERLLEKSSKARAEGNRYVQLTVQRAAAVVHNRRLNTAESRDRSDVE